jgi:tetratricopeptide (TPR) repeat protein
MKTFKNAKTIFKIYSRYQTKTPISTMERELILNQIKVNATEILFHQKGKESKDVEKSKKVSKTVKDTSLLFLRLGDFKNSKDFSSKAIEMCQNLHGEKSIKLVELYYARTKASLFMNEYDDCYNDMFEIISIKNLAKDLEIEKFDVNTSMDEKIIHFILFLSTYFHKVELNDNNFEKLCLDDSTLSLQEIVEKFSVDKRFNVAKEILEEKLNQIDLSEGEKQRENFKQFVFYSTKLGSLFEEKKMKEEASNHYKNAHKYSQELYGKSSPIVASILVDLATSLKDINKFQSRDFAKEATVLLSKLDDEKLRENPHFELKIAKAMTLLGHLYLHLKPEEAMKNLKGSVSIIERIEGKESQNWIDTCYSLLHSLDLLDKSREASFLVTEIEEVVKKFPDDETMAIFHENIGIHFLRCNQYIFSRQHLEKSFNIYEKLGNILMREKVRLFIALVEEREGKSDKSLESVNTSIRILKENNLNDEGISKEISKWNEILGIDLTLDSKGTEFDHYHHKIIRDFKLDLFQKGIEYDVNEEEIKLNNFIKEKTRGDENYQRLIKNYEPTAEDYEQIYTEAKNILSNKEEMEKILNEMKTDPEMFKLVFENTGEKAEKEFFKKLEENRASLAEMTNDILNRRKSKKPTKKKSLKKLLK